MDMDMDGIAYPLAYLRMTYQSEGDFNPKQNHNYNTS